MTFQAIKESPFAYGFCRSSYADTSFKFYKNDPMELKSEVAYYAGRTIRIGLSLVGAVADIALQFFACLLITPVYATIKAEVYLRGCAPSQTFSKYLSFPIIPIEIIRKTHTKDQFKGFAEDVASIAKHLSSNDFFESYTSVMKKILY